MLGPTRDLEGFILFHIWRPPWASQGFLGEAMCSFTVPASFSSLSLPRQGPGSQSTERVLPGVLQAAEAGEAARRGGLLALDAVQPLSHRGADVCF